jgi:hypothetical protein
MDHQEFAQLLGNYGEFVGAVAVVVTLGYLARQLRESNRATRSAAYQAYLERRSNWQSIVADPTVNEQFLSGALDPLNATEKDLQGMHQVMHISMTYFQGVHRLWLEKLLSDAEWEENSVMLSEFRATRGFQLWWPAVNDFMNPGFVEAVEKIAATGTGFERFLSAVEAAKGDGD